MKLYEVTYATNDWTNDRRTLKVVANSVVKAAQEVAKKKFSFSSGFISKVEEVFSSVHIAK